MQVISDNTLDAFDRQAEANFCTRLEAFLKKKVPGLKHEPSDIFQPQLKVLVERARSYGLLTEKQIATFAVTAGFLGPEFDLDFPAAIAMLGAHDVGPEEKAKWLEEFTTTILETLDN